MPDSWIERGGRVPLFGVDKIVADAAVDEGEDVAGGAAEGGRGGEPFEWIEAEGHDSGRTGDGGAGVGCHTAAH